MTGLIESLVLLAAILAVAVWLGVSAYAASGLPIRGRAMLYAPVWVPLAWIAGALLVGPLTALAGAEHCLVDHTHHHHLCVAHPPHHSGTLIAWLAPVALMTVSLLLLARRVRRVALESRLVGTLLTTSTESDLGADVRLLDLAAPLAVTVGIRQPTVLLSRGLLEQVDDDTLRVVLAHERAHVRRRDLLAATCDGIMSALYPPRARRALLRAATTSREIACDALAAREVGSRAQVAKALHRLIQIELAHPCGVSVGDQIPSRVEALLRPRRSVVSWVPLVVLLGIPLHDLLERLVTAILH